MRGAHIMFKTIPDIYDIIIIISLYMIIISITIRDRKPKLIQTHEVKKSIPRKFYAIAISLLLIGGIIGYSLANPSLSYSTIIEEGASVQGYSYIIWRDGSTYYAKNGKSGAIDYSFQFPFAGIFP